MKKQVFALFQALFLICCFVFLFVFHFYISVKDTTSTATTPPSILLSDFKTQIEAPPLASKEGN